MEEVDKVPVEEEPRSEVENLRNPQGREVRIGTETVFLDYPMASFAFLTEKYPDLQTLFSMTSLKGKDSKALFSAQFLRAMADVIYAGLIRPDEDGRDTSGWSSQKILNKVHFEELRELSAAATEALRESIPQGKKNPTKPSARRKK